MPNNAGVISLVVQRLKKKDKISRLLLKINFDKISNNNVTKSNATATGISALFATRPSSRAFLSLNSEGVSVLPSSSAANHCKSMSKLIGSETSSFEDLCGETETRVFWVAAMYRVC